MNTTETCYTIENLRSATRYIVYVTATNEFGTSLPSTRSIAGTPPVLIPTNATLPDIDGEFAFASSSVGKRFVSAVVCSLLRE